MKNLICFKSLFFDIIFPKHKVYIIVEKQGQTLHWSQEADRMSAVQHKYNPLTGKDHITFKNVQSKAGHKTKTNPCKSCILYC